MTRNDFDRASFTPSECAPAQGKLFDPATNGPWRGWLNGETFQLDLPGGTSEIANAKVGKFLLELKIT